MYSFHLSYITFHVKIPDEKIIVEAMLKELLTIIQSNSGCLFGEFFNFFFLPKHILIPIPFMCQDIKYTRLNHSLLKLIIKFVLILK